MITLHGFLIHLLKQVQVITKFLETKGKKKASAKKLKAEESNHNLKAEMYKKIKDSVGKGRGQWEEPGEILRIYFSIDF